MWAETLGLAVSGWAAAALLWHSSGREVARYAAAYEREADRVEGLLTRLQARSLAEYRAQGLQGADVWAAAPAPAEFLYDATGLISVPVEAPRYAGEYDENG